jgi:hypothetical protein
MNWLQDKLDRIQDRFSPQYDLYDTENGEESSSLLQKINDASTLNMTQRFLGFGVCFGMGLLLSLFSQLFILRPVKLATTLTLGNALSIGSMMFLMGPAKQCESMMDEKRRSATVVYLSSLVLTLLAAFLVKSRILCLLCIAVQYSALLWYSLSYVPYGRETLLRFLPAIGRPTDDI